MLIIVLFFTTITFGQGDITFPPDDISCTSKDLELVGAALPAPDEDPCNCTGTRLLELSIYNKTGSTRTSFAFWGYLHRYDSEGDEIGEPEPIFACVGPIPPNSTTTLVSSTEIEVTCDTSLEITDLYLAWTSASPNATCESLANDPGGINPKCGTLDAITVETGVNGTLSVVDADCTTGGSIQVSPFGGVPPYSVQLNGGTGVQLQVGGSTTYSALAASTYTVLITDSRGCTNTFMRTISPAIQPVAEAGSEMELTCTTTSVTLDGSGTSNNPSASLSYEWKDSSDATIGTSEDVTVNSPGTYSLTVTDSNNGCSDTDSVTVTQDVESPMAEAGSDMELTCTTTSVTLDGSGSSDNPSASLSYEWKDSSDATIGTSEDVTVSSPGTYSLTVTDSDNGCSDTDSVTVNQDVESPVAEAGSNMELTCTTTSVTLDGSGTSDNPNASLSYEWRNSSDAIIGTNEDVTVDSPGIYSLTVTDSDNGCSDTDSVTVNQDVVSPVAEAGSDMELTCATTSVTLDGSGTSDNPNASLSYEWKDSSDAIIGTNEDVSVSSSGIYFLTVTDGDNGCSDTDMVTVTSDTDPPSAPTICVVEPSLCGPDTGSITFLSPLGGDYEYSTDGGATYQSSPEFMDLAAGSVSGILVRDTTTGCVSSSVSCGDSDCLSAEARMASTAIPEDTSIKQLPSKTIIKAYPNPFNDQVNFKVLAPEDSKGSLELMNLLGQRVKMVFEGDLKQGENSYNVNLPALQNNTLIYVLTVNGERVTGKLVQSRR
ncbi:T9SS type A sorting domain-containing protein [Mangrovimonas sp. TPBH4]|uniref:PKD domain-containing protein n=1 Tax=Mangrovimonas sp. TPBH4 TaxID=1645914 RepID=UPI0006B59379|nr:T9SS type A sorting domain-containing protein [Mangrovimonas sp. TPBH4]